jgi:TonB family protein
MKTYRNLLVASLLGGSLSTAAFATTTTAHSQTAAAFVAPAPAAVVHPTGLPQSYKDATVTLALTIDETGRPRDIKIMRDENENLAKKLLSAVAQWQFTPARKNGVAVATRVILPLKLVEGADS